MEAKKIEKNDDFFGFSVWVFWGSSSGVFGIASDYFMYAM
jgi:hypothetical protein